MAESPDTQTQLKKRARRRLMGAIAFAGFAAVVLPMVMDEEPKQQMQDVQIRIPGQDQSPFTPGVSAAKLTPAPMPVAVEKKPAQAEPVEPAAASGPHVPSPKELGAPIPRLIEALPARATEKPPEKIADKKAEKVPEKPTKPSDDETHRAAAILAGNAAAVPAASTGAQYVVLIGAFSNAANVKQLENKIAELGVKTYTEPLDSPDGKKTRLRAGPFPGRDAADKALDRLKRIGVNGVVAAKQ